MKHVQPSAREQYEYQVFVNSTETGHYQGVLVVTGYKGEAYEPTIQIPTPTVFKTPHAAEIEAAALADYLIHTGTMPALLSHVEAGNPLPATLPDLLKAITNG